MNIGAFGADELAQKIAELWREVDLQRPDFERLAEQEGKSLALLFGQATVGLILTQTVEIES